MNTLLLITGLLSFVTGFYYANFKDNYAKGTYFSVWGVAAWLAMSISSS